MKKRTALLAFLLINALALALSSIFLSYVGAAVRREWPGISGLRRALRIALTILGSIGIMLGMPSCTMRSRRGCAASPSSPARAGGRGGAGRSRRAACCGGSCRTG